MYNTNRILSMLQCKPTKCGLFTKHYSLTHSQIIRISGYIFTMHPHSLYTNRTERDDDVIVRFPINREPSLRINLRHIWLHRAFARFAEFQPYMGNPVHPALHYRCIVTPNSYHAPCRPTRGAPGSRCLLGTNEKCPPC